MKLEIKHIAPYLPYGLKVNRNGTDWNYEIESCNKEGVITDTSFQHYWEYEVIKPILRPLSDLYKEIDGKVGIVELAKIVVDYGWKLGKHYCDGSDIDVAESTYDIFYYNERHKVFELANIYGIGGVAPNQLDLFAYLFQHHYDVWDLIGQNLAIDKTKIK